MGLLSPSVKALNWDGWRLKSRFLPFIFFLLFVLLKAPLASLLKKKKQKNPEKTQNKIKIKITTTQTKLHKPNETNKNNKKSIFRGK